MRMKHGLQCTYYWLNSLADCQVFFIRSYQLPILSSLRVNPRNRYCFPNIVQMQIESATKLRLLMKQPGNRLCILPINIPPPQILFGPTIFSYSLTSSLPFAACSHSSAQFSMEVDLSFPDAAYSDVIYFVDPTSVGTSWKVRQFLLQESNHLRSLETLFIGSYQNVSKDEASKDLASEYVFASDTQRKYLYKRARTSTSFTSECVFDVLFRPTKVVTHKGVSSSAKSSSWLESMAVDAQLMLFAETDKQSPSTPSLLYVQNVSESSAPLCVARLPFALEVGIVTELQLKKMGEIPLPKLEFTRQKAIDATTSDASKQHTTTNTYHWPNPTPSQDTLSLSAPEKNAFTTSTEVMSTQSPRYIIGASSTTSRDPYTTREGPTTLPISWESEQLVLMAEKDDVDESELFPGIDEDDFQDNQVIHLSEIMGSPEEEEEYSEDLEQKSLASVVSSTSKPVRTEEKQEKYLNQLPLSSAESLNVSASEFQNLTSLTVGANYQKDTSLIAFQLSESDLAVISGQSERQAAVRPAAATSSDAAGSTAASSQQQPSSSVTFS